MKSGHKLVAALPILVLLFTASSVRSETPDKAQDVPASPEKTQPAPKKAQALKKTQAFPSTIQYPSHISAGHVAPPGGVLTNPYKGDKGMAAAGEGLFSSMNCDGCHGGGATGFAAPSLADGRWRYGGSAEEIFQSIYYGRPKGMPAFGGALGSDGIWILVTYLQSLPVPDNVPTQSWEAIEPVTSAVAAPVVATSAPVAKSVPGTKKSTPGNGEALVSKYACIACHAVDKKVVGPAFKEVAAKYRGKANSEKKLVEKVRTGGMGVWGQVPMPANAGVSDEDLHAMVKWILALK